MLTKEQYLLWGKKRKAPGDFSRTVLDELAPRLLDAGDFELKLNHTAARPPRLSIIPFGARGVALFSLTGDQLPDPKWVEELLHPHGAAVAGYRVAESTPRGYDRGWPDGHQTPGIGLLTLFRRRRGLDDTTFLRRWHGGHTPLTFKIHPVWNYVRNVVQRPIIAGSPPFDGIVEEHFREASDLLNPARFFGGPLSMVPNMIRVASDIRGFLDQRSLETYLATELHLRSDGP